MTSNPLPPGLVSNLQEVLSSRKGDGVEQRAAPVAESQQASTSDDEDSAGKPIILVTNGDGIESTGLTCLVEALVRDGLYSVHVCAPQSDKSLSGHCVTLGETVAVTSVAIEGAIAYEVSGTPVDCVSIALSGALFSWSKPLLCLHVISGINRGSSCGHDTFYSGAVAGAREALLSGVPSLSISLNWKKDESQESDYKDAVNICLPLINAAIKDIEKGEFPRNCSFKVEIPTSPSSNKGFKLTKQSTWRSNPSWLAVSANRHPSAGFMSNQQSLGIQLAALSRDASAAGAARRNTTQRKNVEIESIGSAIKSDTNRQKKFFRLELTHKEQEDLDEDLDIKALQNGFVSVSPISISSVVQVVAGDWFSAFLEKDQ